LLVMSVFSRSTHLTAAGLLMLAGHVALDELDRWVKIGWECPRGPAPVGTYDSGSSDPGLVHEHSRDLGGRGKHFYTAYAPTPIMNVIMIDRP
jgi:hypothetical protein